MNPSYHARLELRRLLREGKILKRVTPSLWERFLGWFSKW